MPDISMCTGGDCPMRQVCYRYRARPSEYMQSYFGTPPNKGDQCDYFYHVEPGDRLRKVP